MARGLSQHELASKSGADVAQISRYEKGISEPKASTLGRLADALDVTADFLLGRDNLDGQGIDRLLIRESLALYRRLRTVPDDQDDRLRRLENDPSAPNTADEWARVTHLVDVAAPSQKTAHKKAPETRRTVREFRLPSKG